MATALSERPAERTAPPSAADEFRWLLRAEWTKLRSVRRWVLALLGAVVATVVLGLLAASGSATDVNDNPDFVSGPDGNPVVDDFRFVHQPLTGDGTITARVVDQADSHPDAGAGVMIKDGTRSGSPYAAVLLTPRHGVRLQANFSTDRAGPGGTESRWVRLTREGTAVTGYTSRDGERWERIGTVTPAGLPEGAEIGLFVSSPPNVLIERSPGAIDVGLSATAGRATFDDVRLEPASGPPSSQWRSEPVQAADRQRMKTTGPADGASGPEDEPADVEIDGAITVTGSGKVGPNSPDDDPVQIALFGVVGGLMALIAVGALYMTAEYRRGMVRTTFTATPRRGRVLAAKAIVLGAVAFVIGIVAGATTVLLARPVLQDNGFGPPGFPEQSLLDGAVLRAVVLTAAFLAALAVFSLALGVILRHSAAAITIAVVLVIAPAIVGTMLPAEAGRTLMHLTPAGGFATQRSRPPTEALAEPWSMLSAWTGLGVVCVYAVGALLLARELLRRRDA